MPLALSVAKSLRQYMDLFAPASVTMPWNDPGPAQTPVAAKHVVPRRASFR